MPVASVIGAGLRALLARRASLLADRAHWQANAGATQRAQLRNLLRTASGTAIGAESGFARLASLDDQAMVREFRAALPVTEYPAFRHRLLRARDGGEPGVVWPGLTMDWAQTSGTTAGDKFIPVTRAMMRSNNRSALDVFAHAMNNGASLPALFGGRLLFMGGSTDLALNDHGMRTGDLSGIVTRLIRWPISTLYLPGRDIALMSDWTKKIDAMARLCLAQDVRVVSGMASWALVLFNRMLEIARESGRPASSLRDLWPNFGLFIHGGVKYAPFDPRVREAWSGAASGPGSDIPLRVEVYPASEGWIATQDIAGEPSLRLNADRGIFFEFVPLDEYEEGHPRALACDEVEPGVRYVVVLTTCAGLWRYVLGDVVEFDQTPRAVGSHAGPPRLRIVGRHKHFINAFGENLIVENIEDGVAAAAHATGERVGEFSACPVYPDAASGVRAGLELAIEFEDPAMRAGAAEGDRRLRAFRDAFDSALKARCVDYGIKRKDDLGMVAPTVTPLPVGSFHRWMASRGKLGGQHKCPRCANHREIVDAVRAMAGVRVIVAGAGARV